MNGMATSGKNLQTVFAVAEVKGAYEIRLISQRAGVAQLEPPSPRSSFPALT